LEVVQALGKYEVRGTLGRGAMGVVYDGWDPLIARRVAIKAVRLPEHPEPETEEEIARFRREAQAAGRLSHPNIVAVYDYGETSDLAYIVMEFVDGTTLKHLLDRQERFAIADTARIMQDVLSGLQFSHGRGVVHRDIKPANVILTSAGQAKIADFGIARIESSSMTQAGTVLGTPAYMSPEQFMGQVVDARTDIYSTGVLLYQLLTGERPFEGSMTAIMHKVLNTDPPPPSQLAVTSPVPLDAVVRRAMSKRPEDRYPSAAAFGEAITAALAARPAAMPPEPEAEATLVSVPVRPSSAPAAAAVSPPQSAAKRSGMPLVIAAAVAGIAVLATGGWFVLRPVPATKVADVQPSGGSAPPSTQPAPALSTQAAPPPSAATSTAPAPLRQAANPSPTGEAAAPAPAAAPPTKAAAVPPATSPSPPIAPPSPAPPAAPETTASTQPPPSAARPAATGPKPEPPPAAPAAVSAPAGGTAANQPSLQPTPPQSPGNTSVAPPPEQVAAIGLGSLRQQIERVLSAAPCVLVDGAVQDGGAVTVTGIAGRLADDALRHEVTDAAGSHALDWRVQRVDPVFCDALSAIRPVTPLAGAPDLGLRLVLAGGRTALHEDQYIQPRVTMPGFAGRLRVDYLAHDGSLEHLYPTVADPQDHYVAVPARTLHSGQVLELGNPGGGRPQWQVAPPFGTDMIIAVASSVPLFDSPPPNQEDNGSDYVRRLGRAIEAARSRGASVSAAVMLVDTLPKSP